jgi:hypothetical protein
MQSDDMSCHGSCSAPFSQALWWFALPKSTRPTGADIVYGIITLIEVRQSREYPCERGCGRPHFLSEFQGPSYPHPQAS